MKYPSNRWFICNSEHQRSTFNHGIALFTLHSFFSPFIYWLILTSIYYVFAVHHIRIVIFLQFHGNFVFLLFQNLRGSLWVNYCLGCVGSGTSYHGFEYTTFKVEILIFTSLDVTDSLAVWYCIWSSSAFDINLFLFTKHACKHVFRKVAL